MEKSRACKFGALIVGVLLLVAIIVVLIVVFVVKPGEEDSTSTSQTITFANGKSLYYDVRTYAKKFSLLLHICPELK